MAAALAAPPLTVLLVEDDAGDVALIEDFFDTSGLRADLKLASDGVEALSYLEGPEPTPDLILLDLNMPRMNGRELLRILKAPQSRWRTVPVIVLTTSTAENDVRGSYQDHANAYVAKEINYDRFHASLAEIQRFFSQVAVLYRPEDL